MNDLRTGYLIPPSTLKSFVFHWILLIQNLGNGHWDVMEIVSTLKPLTPIHSSSCSEGT